MARATVALNSHQAEQWRRVQALGVSLKDLAEGDPSSFSDADRQAISDVLRHVQERFTRHDKIAASIGGLSAGASALLQHLKGTGGGTVAYPDEWRKLFGSEEDAQAAARELERKGLATISRVPGIAGASSLGLTQSGQAALDQAK